MSFDSTFLALMNECSTSEKPTHTFNATLMTNNFASATNVNDT